MATRKRATKPHQLTAHVATDALVGPPKFAARDSGATGALARPSKLQRRGSKPRTVPEIHAAAVTRDGRILPTWPEKGTGRTAPLATCGHCGGKPLIIRRCGTEPKQRGEGHKPRPRYCAVCENCGAHRAIQASPGGVAI
jgi:hypothetical protein